MGKKPDNKKNDKTFLTNIDALTKNKKLLTKEEAKAKGYEYGKKIGGLTLTGYYE